jgi:xanthine dehydrogenase/oxidase
MSLYSELQKKNPDVEDCFDGNLCRCTGYRPILDGARKLMDLRDNHCGKDCDTCPTQDTCDFADIEDSVKPTALQFPSQLASYYEQKREPFLFRNGDFVWANPSTKSELLELMNEHKNAKIINGNTEVGIEVRFKNQKYQVHVNPSDVNEMKSFSVIGMYFGSPKIRNKLIV